MRPGSRIPDAVLSYALPTGEDLFAELSASAHLEDTGKGRRGAVLTRTDAAGGVPLVRTTTRYGGPAQPFRAVHERLAREIRERAALPVGFNNALVERYTNAYRTMGGHSDQALDLADGSFIAVLSCYRHPEAGPPRKLIFESKEPGGETFEIPLAHHGVVAFSVDTNRLFRHRIVLDAPAPAADNEWLGVTFRTSKTYVRFRDGDAFLPQGARLVPADEEQRHEFYRLRRRENNETDFVYPPLTYTVSESDLMPPVRP
ncbi:alpha-ketoglutarate-dependent dioxygenase AlkB [Streptomyces sp. NPDC002057]|uniref:alpha-ketoglutarate-dependent dioxygenase AlkB n=1 Tax=Streptomyces sp. NPDC002057 TaxID=3154664 RepID=UPI00332C0FE1